MPIVAAMRLYAGNGGIYGAGQNTVTAGEAASGFVLPLILDIGIFSFLALIVIMLAPPEDEILADARLAGRLTGGAGQPPPLGLAGCALADSGAMPCNCAK